MGHVKPPPVAHILYSTAAVVRCPQVPAILDTNQLCFSIAPYRTVDTYPRHDLVVIVTCVSCATAEEGMALLPLQLRFSRELLHVKSRDRLGTDYQGDAYWHGADMRVALQAEIKHFNGKRVHYVRRS